MIQVVQRFTITRALEQAGTEASQLERIANTRFRTQNKLLLQRSDAAQACHQPLIRPSSLTSDASNAL